MNRLILLTTIGLFVLSWSLNLAFARLKENPKAWEEEKEERRLFENTLKDGLKDE